MAYVHRVVKAGPCVEHKKMQSYLKEKPCDNYARESGRFPYMGLMASEGGRRQKALMLNGCNYISKDTKRSAPFAIFDRQDVLTLALEMEEYYHEHWEEFGTWEIDQETGAEMYVPPKEHLETIVPAIYGEIVRDPLDMTPEEIEQYRQDHDGAEPEGQLRTTKAQRTGCSMCGFGIHIEHRPHRFDLLRHQNPKEWEMWMNHICQDETGEQSTTTSPPSGSPRPVPFWFSTVKKRPNAMTY